MLQARRSVAFRFAEGAFRDVVLSKVLAYGTMNKTAIRIGPARFERRDGRGVRPDAKKGKEK
jgi:hypothetical protein